MISRNISRLFLVLTVGLIGGVLAVFNVPAAQAASRDPEAEKNVAKFCLRTVPARLKSVCDKGTIADIVAAADKEDDTACGGPDHTSCITSLGNQYIRQVLKKNPKSAAEFKKELKKILDKAKTKGVDPGNNTDVCLSGKCFGDPAADPNADCSNDRCDLIKKYVNPTINLLSLCFGVIAAGSLIAGGIQYSASTGDAQKVTNAKKRIFNTILAVVVYMFMWSFLQFLVPGGIFG